MQIASMRQLRELAADGATILVKRDLKLKMASIWVAGRSFMGGSFWDFKPECHGGYHYELARTHGKWMSPRGLAETIRRFLMDHGATNVTIVDEEYDWSALMDKSRPHSGAAA
jgi:hypothetical protein